METLATRTRGGDIFTAVKNTCIRNGFDLTNLRGIRGAPAMMGNSQGFVARFSEYVSKEYDNKELINLHCIIHQEALCAKSVAINVILKDVNRIILFIRANALHHRQFRELLQSSETSAEDILYHTAVRWLSQGETSHRALRLHKEIIEYYSLKNKDCPLLNTDFLTSLAFLVDFLTFVNNLNQSLQGKATTVCLMYKKVLDFRDKCRLLKGHLQQREFIHFPQLTALIDSKEIQVDKIPIVLFSGVFDTVLQDFGDRFQDFRRSSKTLRLVAFPHLVDTENAPLHLQMELLELKNDEQLVQKFKDEENLLNTWKGAVAYPVLRELARKTLVLFGSTYTCEATFSKMKYLKNEYRTRLLDVNLESQLRLMVSNQLPDFASLSADMQDQGSH
ncbi:general transcription factor II-I repeat domain-containing protein 2-like [Styela clava]